MKVMKKIGFELELVQWKEMLLSYFEKQVMRKSFGKYEKLLFFSQLQ